MVSDHVKPTFVGLTDVRVTWFWGKTTWHIMQLLEVTDNLKHGV